MANFLGQQWTAFPLVTNSRQLNILRGVLVVLARILHLIFLEKGEDPVHPTMGLGVPLFYPLTDDRAEWAVYNVKSELINWNQWAAIGIKSLEVEVNDQRVFTNEISISIRYVPIGAGESMVLTLGFFEYTKAKAEGNADAFLDAIVVNGVRLRDWGLN